jgi:hypothetical protein
MENKLSVLNNLHSIFKLPLFKFPETLFIATDALLTIHYCEIFMEVSKYCPLPSNSNFSLLNHSLSKTKDY